MPTDPSKCRWCGGTLRALLEFEEPDYCQNGCAKNDQAPFTADCRECNREFKTGRRLIGATFCYECEKAGIEQLTEAHKPLPRKVYSYKAVGRGRYLD